MALLLKINPRLRTRELKALFASTWHGRSGAAVPAMLKHALVYVGAYERGRLVGFAKDIGDGGVHGFLLDPTVAPEHQRKGVGRRLVGKCAKEVKRRGVEWLHVDFEPRLAKFYRACGFSPSQAGLLNLETSQGRRLAALIHSRVQQACTPTPSAGRQLVSPRLNQSRL